MHTSAPHFKAAVEPPPQPLIPIWLRVPHQASSLLQKVGRDLPTIASRRVAWKRSTASMALANGLLACIEDPGANCRTLSKSAQDMVPLRAPVQNLEIDRESCDRGAWPDNAACRRRLLGRMHRPGCRCSGSSSYHCIQLSSVLPAIIIMMAGVVRIAPMDDVNECRWRFPPSRLWADLILRFLRSTHAPAQHNNDSQPQPGRDAQIPVPWC